MRRGTRTFIFSLAAVTLGACDKDPNATKLQYMPDMADAPTVKAQEDFLDPPDGAVAMSAILYPESAEEAEKQLQNPFAGGQDSQVHLDAGKALFETYCAVCHGPDAKGEGTIVDKFPRPPDLTTDNYINRADGFYFYRITFGSLSGIMPRYGHAVSPHERWQIVMYLRTLQKAGK